MGSHIYREKNQEIEINDDDDDGKMYKNICEMPTNMFLSFPQPKIRKVCSLFFSILLIAWDIYSSHTQYDAI